MGMVISAVLMGFAIVFFLAFAMDVYFKKAAIILAFILAMASLVLMFMFVGRHTL